MISILNELTLEIGDATSEEEVTLWLVNYGEQPSRHRQRRTRAFIDAFSRWCLSQGWLLETGDDPYLEQSLRIFGGDGFSLPEPESGR